MKDILQRRANWMTCSSKRQYTLYTNESNHPTTNQHNSSSISSTAATQQKRHAAAIAAAAAPLTTARTSASAFSCWGFRSPIRGDGVGSVLFRHRPTVRAYCIVTSTTTVVVVVPGRRYLFVWYSRVQQCYFIPLAHFVRVVRGESTHVRALAAQKMTCIGIRNASAFFMHNTLARPWDRQS